VKNRDRALISALVIGVLGSIAGLGVFGAFSATTTNAGNEVNTGTVTLTDNDTGSALYNLPNARPGDSVSRCIKVTFSGSLDSDVHLYMPDDVGPISQYVNLTITPGTQAAATFPSCTGFTAGAYGPVYTGTLQNLSATHDSFATGLDKDPGNSLNWSPNTSAVYKFDVVLAAGTPSALEGASTGTHTYVWEASSNVN
jgi:hypothetical protein